MNTSWFERLLAAHVPTDPAEATLVLAAAAAFHGLRADGARMPDAFDACAPTLRQLAGELGLHVGAVRRGVRHLEAAGVVRVDGGVHVTAEALQARWAARGAVIRLSAELRHLGLRAVPLLLAGFVAGQVDRHGRLVLGQERLCARTGVANRTTLRRALDAAEAAGAIHRWTIPGSWLTCCAPGPRRREVAQEKDPGGGAHREVAQEIRREVAQESLPFSTGPSARREVAQGKASPDASQSVHPPSRSGASSVAKWRTPRREVAQVHPDCIRTPDVHPDQTRAGAREAERTRHGAEAEPAEAGKGRGVPDRGPVHALVRAILRTTLRDRLPAFARLQFAHQLAVPLARAGMTETQFDRCVEIAQRRASSGDYGGLLATILAGNWLATIDEAEERASHSAAMARGGGTRAAEGRDGPYGRPDPVPAGDLAAGVAARLRQA